MMLIWKFNPPKANPILEGFELFAGKNLPFKVMHLDVRIDQRHSDMVDPKHSCKMRTNKVAIRR